MNPRRWWAPVEVRATLPAPPEDVYAVLAAPETYPDWLVGAQRIRGVDPEFPAPGTEFDHTVGVGGPLTVDDETEARLADPPHRLVLEVHLGPFRGRVDFGVSPAPIGAELVFGEVPLGPAKALMPLLRPVLRARNAESLRRLERFLLAVAPDVGDEVAGGDQVRSGRDAASKLSP